DAVGRSRAVHPRARAVAPAAAEAAAGGRGPAARGRLSDRGPGRPPAPSSSALGDRELLLGAKPVLDRVSALVEVDVVRTLRNVLPREHDRLLRLLLAARDSPLGHRLRRRGGLSG